MGEGIKKEYCLLPDGLTVLGKSVSVFAKIPEVNTIIITIPADGEADAKKALPPSLLADGALPSILFVHGGATRQASVFNALSAISAQDCDFVLIHDGARPWVSPSLVMRIIAQLR